MEPYLLVAMVLAFFMVIASIVGYFAIREVYSRRYVEDQNNVRTNSVVEEVLYEMLQNETLPRRKFSIIKDRIGGLGDDEIRRILLRIGAVRFMGGQSGEEFWGLLERNRDGLLTDVEKSIKAGEKLVLTEMDAEEVKPVVQNEDVISLPNKVHSLIPKTDAKRIMVSSPDFKEVLSVVQDTTLFEEQEAEDLSNSENALPSKEKAAE